jgi:hypothetical protein
MATCKHGSTSLVQGEMRSTYKDRDNNDKSFGPFLTVQCDICGAVLPRVEIDDATLFAWNNGTLKVPALDGHPYRTATEAIIRDLYAEEVARLETFAAAVRG